MPRVYNKILDVNCPSNALFIGRPSKWGNPFIIGKDGNRSEVIKKHLVWLLDDNPLLNDLHELTGKDLVCYCSPLACHGDILLKLANEDSK